jgi:AGCS family alanine or glycine:cation symporter
VFPFVSVSVRRAPIFYETISGVLSVQERLAFADHSSARHFNLRLPAVHHHPVPDHPHHNTFEIFDMVPKHFPTPRFIPGILLLLGILVNTCPAQEASPPDVATETTAAVSDDAASPAVDSQKQDTASASGKAEAAASIVAEKPGDLFALINKELEPVDKYFEAVNGHVGGVIFFPIPLGGGNKIQFAVLILVLGAAFFTFYMGFINLRGFRHSIDVIAGKYDNANATGDVSHFQALTTALSATVGLGNIAGVTTAIAIGGPGAAFWMVLAGFLGMSSKFVECTLGQKYREVRPDGSIMGGAMYYLSRGLAELGLAPLGKVFAVAFALLCIGGSFAGGNSYQVNGSLATVGQTIPFFNKNPWVYGLIMLVLTAIVIIGGIKRIASTADKIVPIMCSVYVLAGLLILLKNYSEVPAALATIFSSAFNPDAYRGGFVGVLVWGFKRAAFSNEAGVGSAAIAHAAAKTDYPIREGIVSLLEPFVDTIVVCTMTALVIVVTGAYDYKNPEFPAEFKAQYTLDENGVAIDIKGAALTSVAMDSQIPYFKYVLAFATFMFAYSTMISWSYYGERCWAYLFGEGASMIYRIIFLVFTFLGSVVSARNVMEFGDLMIFGMMLPNMLGLFLLSGKVKADLQSYWAKLKSGEMDREHQEKVRNSSR